MYKIEAGRRIGRKGGGCGQVGSDNISRCKKGLSEGHTNTHTQVENEVTTVAAACSASPALHGVLFYSQPRTEGGVPIKTAEIEDFYEVILVMYRELVHSLPFFCPNLKASLRIKPPKWRTLSVQHFISFLSSALCRRFKVDLSDEFSPG